MTFKPSPQSIVDWMKDQGLIIIERRDLDEITAENDRLRILEKAFRNFAQADQAVRQILKDIDQARDLCRAPEVQP